MGYDIIGDIHGQVEKLESLLTRMGYHHRQGAWRHTERTAIFVGDFIDRGRRGVETVQTRRASTNRRRYKVHARNCRGSIPQWRNR